MRRSLISPRYFGTVQKSRTCKGGCGTATFTKKVYPIISVKVVFYSKKWCFLDYTHNCLSDVILFPTLSGDHPSRGGVLNSPLSGGVKQPLLGECKTATFEGCKTALFGVKQLFLGQKTALLVSKTALFDQKQLFWCQKQLFWCQKTRLLVSKTALFGVKNTSF